MVHSLDAFGEGMMARRAIGGLRALAARCGLAAVIVSALACGGGEPASVPEDATPSVYAAPGGWSGGDGTREHPYDLKTALSAASTIQPGGTVWLLGGTYRTAEVTSVLTGTEQAPITVRSLPGQTAVIDGAQAAGAALTIHGAWTVYRDFEMTNSDPRRSGPDLLRAGAIDVHATKVKLINLVIHDFASGIGMGSDAVDCEAYGNIVYYNGVARPEGAQGHGIFGQNKTGTRLITDNVVFGQFGSGIRAYASDQGFLDDIQLEGNVSTNNGIPDGDYSILLGGHRVAQRLTLTANYVYDNPGAGINLGYAAGCDSTVLTDNYFAVLRGGYATQLVNCSAALKGNVLIGATRGIQGETIVTQEELAAKHPGNQFTELPKATRTFVRPNRYEPGRAHVIVYNWAHTKDVSVDLTSAGLAAGTAFSLRDVRNLSARPVVSGTYTGAAIAVPLEGLTPAPMIGWEPAPPHTAPEFAVFLLTSTPAGPSTTTSLMTRLKGLLGL